MKSITARLDVLERSADTAAWRQEALSQPRKRITDADLAAALRIVATDEELASTEFQQGISKSWNLPHRPEDWTSLIEHIRAHPREPEASAQETTHTLTKGSE